MGSFIHSGTNAGKVSAHKANRSEEFVFYFFLFVFFFHPRCAECGKYCDLPKSYDFLNFLCLFSCFRLNVTNAVFSLRGIITVL